LLRSIQECNVKGLDLPAVLVLAHALPPGLPAAVLARVPAYVREKYLILHRFFSAVPDSLGDLDPCNAWFWHVPLVQVMRRLVNPARVLSPGLYKTGPKGKERTCMSFYIMPELWIQLSCYS
jgi:hypothetical protein